MRLVPKKEACFRLGVSRATIDRRVGRPDYPQPRKDGVRVYYVESELNDYISKLPPTTGKAHNRLP